MPDNSKIEPEDLKAAAIPEITLEDPTKPEDPEANVLEDPATKTKGGDQTINDGPVVDPTSNKALGVHDQVGLSESKDMPGTIDPDILKARAAQPAHSPNLPDFQHEVVGTISTIDDPSTGMAIATIVPPENVDKLDESMNHTDTRIELSKRVNSVFENCPYDSIENRERYIGWKQAQAEVQALLIALAA